MSTTFPSTRFGKIMKKSPPLEKIAEAFSAITDGRVHLSDGYATVASSDGKKEYRVTWNGDTYASSDSATYWQGYAGYPVIAVLLLQKRLPYDEEMAVWFSGINWTELNTRHKRDYAAALNGVMTGIAERGGDTEKIFEEIRTIYQHLNNLPLTIKRGTVKPPKKP